MPEQFNALTNGCGGAVRITEDPSALRRWMVADLEFTQIVSQYEHLSGTKNSNEEVEHRELNNQVQRLFIQRVDKLYITMKEMGNPFMEDMKKPLVLDTKHVTQRCAAEMVTDGIDKGNEKFDDFMKSLQVKKIKQMFSTINGSNI